MAPKKTVSKPKKGAQGSGAPSASTAGGAAAPTAAPPSDVPLISVRYSSEPLSFHHHFGHEGGADLNVPFSSNLELPVFRDRAPERVEIISQASPATIRAIVTDAQLETSDRKTIKKPAFLFGDSIEIDTSIMYDGNYKWLREIGGRRLFLPNMERMFPISYFQRASIPRSMNWDIVREQGGVSVGQLTSHGVHPAGYSRQLVTLRPGSIKKDHPAGETPQLANTFIRKFLLAKGEFPAQGFRSPGWVNSTSAGWWTRMINFVMEELRGLVENSGLGIPLLATRYGIAQNHYGFFAMLELYNPDSCTFFTPVGELGFALHEMFEVSGLPFGELPYEEFIPGTEELAILRKTNPEIYDTYWELMCHFHICAQVTGVRGGGVKQGSWAEYLFQNLNDKELEVSRLSPSTLEAVNTRIDAATAHYVNEATEDKFPAHTEFDSFHYQALTPISDMALFAGFLMLWLKRCVVPTRPVDALAAEVAYPAVLLAYGRPLNLLSAMVSCIQRGLRELTSEFIGTKEVDLDGVKTIETPCPRVSLPYTYLVSWFVLHCPSLMTTPAIGDASIPLVHRLETAQWAGWYQVLFRQILSKEFNYTIFRCFPNFEGGAYGAVHQDTKGSNSFTILNNGVFRWLLNIRPGYLIFRQGGKCFIEPYQPYRFSRQFGYDQLYIGNPNPRLAFTGDVYEGARAWYYSVAGCTGATFRLPHKVPNAYTSLSFCTWFHAASKIPEYKIYTSCLKVIRKMYESKRHSKKSSRLRGIEEFISSEQEAAAGGESEAAATTKQGPAVAAIKAKKATGKRALTTEETSRPEKRARRKLSVESPTSKTEQGVRLMESAFKAAAEVSMFEEEAQESSVAGLSHQVGLRSTGPALAGEASSYHPIDEEGGDETEAGDAESAPVAVTSAQPAAEDFPGAEIERAGGSLSSSALMPMPEASGVSPTTGLLSKPIIIESPEGSHEKVSFGTSEDDEPQDESPVSPHGSPAREATSPLDQPATITSSPDQQTVVSPTVTPPPTRSVPLVISLRPVHETSVPGSFSAGALTVLPSSPSNLGVLVPSVASSPVSPVAVTPMLATSVATSSSPKYSLSPVVVPNLLGTFVEHLELMMRMTVETVSAGQGDFESFKPFLLNYLHNVEQLGDAQCIKRCSEGISRLEGDLKVLQELSSADFDARIESTFAEVQAQAMHRYELIQKNLSEKEMQVASSKTQYEQWQHELTSATSAMQAARESITTLGETIAQLQAEMAEQQDKFSREETNVKDLTRKSVESYQDYRQEIQALEAMREEAAISAPNEEGLRREAVELARAAYDKDVAEVKSRLASIKLRGPSA